MKTYIEPECSVTEMDLRMMICASFDDINDTELFAIDDIETI